MLWEKTLFTSFEKTKRQSVIQLSIPILFLMLSIPIYCSSATKSQIEYTKFFAEYENIFQYRPQLVKDIFFSIVELRGNKAVARKNIDHQVLGCYPDSGIDQGCRIERLQQERKKRGIPQKLVLPVNFTHLSERIYDKKKKRLTLQWNPDLIQPPVISVDNFLEYITAARESKYYKVLSGIDLLQLNTLFEQKLEIIIENELAANLLDLYEQPRTDFQDSVTIAFDFLTTGKRFNIMDCTMQFKVVEININHQNFRTSQIKR